MCSFLTYIMCARSAGLNNEFMSFIVGNSPRRSDNHVFSWHENMKEGRKE